MALVREEWAVTIVGTMLTGENWSTLRISCLSATLSNICVTWNDLGSNPGLCCARPVTNRFFLKQCSVFVRHVIRNSYFFTWLSLTLLHRDYLTIQGKRLSGKSPSFPLPSCVTKSLLVRNAVDGKEQAICFVHRQASA